MQYARASQVAYFRDFIWSFVVLAFGRLFPTLHVPHTNLAGKTAIITGANSGIGFEIALEIARRGATVYLACRNISKAEDAISKIVSKVPSSAGQVKALSLDTSSLSSIRAFAEEWKALDGRTNQIEFLFHNAGSGSAPPGQEYTSDGLLCLYVTNFLGSFLLTYLLEKHLVPDARIIMTTSTGQYQSDILPTFSLKSVKNNLEPGFHAPSAQVVPGKSTHESSIYVNTKMMQIAFAKLLQQRFDRQANEAGAQNRRLAHAFTPGFTMTEAFGNLTAKSAAEDPVWVVLRATTVLATDPGQGAATGHWLATTRDEAVVGAGNGGGYWERMTRRVSKGDVMESETVERLWVRWEADAGIEWR